MTKAKPKTKSKPSRALVVHKSKPPAAPAVTDEIMRLVREGLAGIADAVEKRERARDEADASKSPLSRVPNTTIDLADVLLVKEAAYIVHFSNQNIYHNIGYVGFAIGPVSFVSNAKLREHWPDKYDEERFWETARLPRNKERFASILATILPESQMM
jgi:hypothetical protein